MRHSHRIIFHNAHWRITGLLNLRKSHVMNNLLTSNIRKSQTSARVRHFLIKTSLSGNKRLTTLGSLMILERITENPLNAYIHIIFFFFLTESISSCLISYSSCCWISLSQYAGSSSWRVETTVDLTRRSDTGRINSSPLSRSAAFVRFHEGCPQSIRIPTEDPDGDVVRCRHATYSESYKYDYSFPYGVLDEVTK